jgi:hypothetical protein
MELEPRSVGDRCDDGAASRMGRGRRDANLRRSPSTGVLPDASNGFRKIRKDIAPPLKPLISQSPSTVHGVVFAVFVRDHTPALAQSSGR